MIETVRSVLAERGLERGCRFMVTANFLDDMRIHLLFNRLGRHAQRVLDRQRRARAMGDDADAVHSEQRHAAVFLVVRLFLDGLESAFRARYAPTLRIVCLASVRA